MAKRKVEVSSRGKPQVGPLKGAELLQKEIQKGQALLASRPLSSDDASSWELLVKNLLEKAFGVGSPNIEDITGSPSSGSMPLNPSEDWFEERRVDRLRSQVKKLESLVELLQTESQLASEGVARVQPPKAGHKIFLVHGHDERVLHEVARFLEKLDQEVIILRELPNSGRTIIEKFEEFADVGFAVVLLTADDRGARVGVEYEDQRLRARQNVLFELGYFIGRLGRARVCAMNVPGIEIPSDYSGVLYVELDESGAWRLALAKELKAAGLNVDLNAAV